MQMTSERYENLDGMRAYACIGIIMMHVLTNGNFGLKGFAFEKVIPSFTDFTYLFMILSAFSLCCGYFAKFSEGYVDIERFYSRRYHRIWPYFSLLCTVELIIDHNLNSLYEWFADITLAFGLIQNHHIGVVGVGWFLGVVFVFYMIFPFYCFLINNKLRAWLMMGVTIIINILCHLRFEEAVGRANFIFSSMFFAAGGMIYIYRDKLVNKTTSVVATLCTVAVVILYFTVDNSDYTMLVLFSLLSIVGISSIGDISRYVFQNRPIRFLGTISMEIYLCHMFIYRIIEKLRVQGITSQPLINYVLTASATIVGAIILSLILKKAIDLFEKQIINKW